MPELPEVETTLRGIQPALGGSKITKLIVREPRLRWPITASLPDLVKDQRVKSLKRRAKYIIIQLQTGSLILHLGMSGSIRVVNDLTKLKKHDHYDLVLESKIIIRYNDPRRFGCLLWADAAMDHPLLAKLGPEPLSDDFKVDQLYLASRGRRVAVKNFIMDQKTVVGVGNIYASESLFLAGILPNKPAGKVSKARYADLVKHIKDVLARAINQGGTSLQDFNQVDGKPGYFEQKLLVYGRAGEPCLQCDQLIQNQVIGQRASYYCAACQT